MPTTHDLLPGTAPPVGANARQTSGNCASSSDADALFDCMPLLANEKRLDLTFLHAISTPKTQRKTKKRSLTSTEEENDESDDGGGTSCDGSDSKGTAGAPPPTTVQSKKQRKPTYILRKESKEQLQDQIRHLEARAALLRQEQGLEDPKVTESKLALHADLREAVLHQDLIIANTQSAISGFVVRTCCVYLSALVAPNRYVETRLPSIQNSRATSPLETYIHLTRDWNQRREALLAMKEKKIETAHRFLMERTRHMDPLKKCCEVSQFESDDGDFYTVKVDVTPFEGVKSVRQVFESLLFYFLNVEISITEISGNVTVRENTDDSEKTVLHHRLVTCEPSGILVEKNSVLFLDQSGLDAENVDEQYVLITSDFVDQDDLYPYCPRERLRKDGTTAIKLSAHWRKRPQREGTLTESVEDELVVVLTRWHLFRLRRPEMDVPKDAVHAISDDMSRSVDIMLRSTKEGLYPTAVVQ